MFVYSRFLMLNIDFTPAVLSAPFSCVKILDNLEEGYISMEGGDPPKAPTPTMTPLSETAGIAQPNVADFGATGQEQASTTPQK